MAPLLLHVVGARPNLPKLAPVWRALDGHPVEQLLVHTGQHVDDRLSGIFFRQLGLPEPDLNLGLTGGSHATQTAAVLTALETVLLEHRPALVVVYGDVNPTVAATLAAVKLQIPVAHVEAGLRSFDRSMPEEVNRLVTDRLSSVLLTTCEDADAHLLAEGVAAEQIHFVGNPMIDTLLQHRDGLADGPPPVPGLPGRYVVSTLHRPGNVDSSHDAAELASSIRRVAEQVEVVIPLHPRGRRRLSELLDDDPRVHLVDPLGYLEFLALVDGAAAVVTDSGGVQEETTVLGVPCLTVRPNTERPVTITHGTNRLVTRSDLPARVEEVLAGGRPQQWPVPPRWDGHAGPRIADVLADRVAD